MFRGRLQKDEGISFGSTKQVSQNVNQSVFTRNPGILFHGNDVPSSRPLHIYRKTGPNHVITTPNAYNQCTISATDWKMLGKNSYKYTHNVSCETCKDKRTFGTCQCISTGCPVPMKGLCKAPYYYDNSVYLKKKCFVAPTTVPAYNVVKTNNPNFKSTWGSVTASNWTLRKKYDAIILNNSSLLREYQRRLNYSETPLSEAYRLTFKKPEPELCNKTC